jgi:hypothetical protein
MRLVFRTKSGPVETKGEITKRYKVVSNNSTQDADIQQFWTWLKYEFPHLDQNKEQKVFGANLLDFNKIHKQWQTKFTFES